MRQASRELCLRGVNGLTAEACHRVGEPPARPRTPAPQPRYRPACRRGGPPRRRQTGLASLRHRPYGLYHVRPALLRRGCHIHVVSATWLGHPRRIPPGQPGGRRAPPVTAARPDPAAPDSRRRSVVRVELAAEVGEEQPRVTWRRMSWPGRTYDVRRSVLAADDLCGHDGFCASSLDGGYPASPAGRKGTIR